MDCEGPKAKSAARTTHPNQQSTPNGARDRLCRPFTATRTYLANIDIWAPPDGLHPSEHNIGAVPASEQTSQAHNLSLSLHSSLLAENANKRYSYDRTRLIKTAKKNTRQMEQTSHTRSGPLSGTPWGSTSLPDLKASSISVLDTNSSSHMAMVHLRGGTLGCPTSPRATTVPPEPEAGRLVLRAPRSRTDEMFSMVRCVGVWAPGQSKCVGFPKAVPRWVQDGCLSSFLNKEAPLYLLRMGVTSENYDCPYIETGGLEQAVAQNNTSCWLGPPLLNNTGQCFGH